MLFSYHRLLLHFSYHPQFLPNPTSLKPPPPHFSLPSRNDNHVIGDSLVFEQGIFDDPYLSETTSIISETTSIISETPNPSKNKKTQSLLQTETDNLVPDEWRDVQAEINITKQQKRKIARELEFNSRFQRKRNGLVPERRLNLEEYKSYRDAKLAQLNPILIDNPSNFPPQNDSLDEEIVSERVAPKNPRWAVYGRGFDDVNQFFNSPNYQPSPNNSQVSPKMFTKEEKVLMNKRTPDLVPATSSKWLPLHTLAASGELYLMDALFKHNVDVNAADADGLTALHKAITCKKQAITSFLLRESANPFVRDADGATLMHYAVQTASAPAIKLLLLYNVDINLQDNDGWTPLHLAVQARRTDIVTLLLVRGADKTRRNKDGLTPLELCLHYGKDTRTYELVKRLKQITRKSNFSPKTAVYNMAAS